MKQGNFGCSVQGMTASGFRVAPLRFLTIIISYDARIVCREVNYNESTKLITMTDGIECARHNNAIFSLSINKSRLASGGADKYLWVWDMQVKNAIGGYKMLHKIPTGHVGDINTVHWLSDTLVRGLKTEFHSSIAQSCLTASPIRYLQVAKIAALK
jgi:WD40 repeat protein